MEVTIKHFNELSGIELHDILMARQAVFVVEQRCPYMDIDGLDTTAHHLTFKENGTIKAYLRINALDRHTVRLGRIITTERGKGYGLELLNKGIEVAKMLFAPDTLYIEAQTYAIGFYEKAGFKACSDIFMEDGIPHVKMTLKLNT